MKNTRSTNPFLQKGIKTTFVNSNPFINEEKGKSTLAGNSNLSRKADVHRRPAQPDVKVEELNKIYLQARTPSKTGYSNPASAKSPMKPSKFVLTEEKRENSASKWTSESSANSEKPKGEVEDKGIGEVLSPQALRVKFRKDVLGYAKTVLEPPSFDVLQYDVERMGTPWVFVWSRLSFRGLCRDRLFEIYRVGDEVWLENGDTLKIKSISSDGRRCELDPVSGKAGRLKFLAVTQLCNKRFTPLINSNDALTLLLFLHFKARALGSCCIPSWAPGVEWIWATFNSVPWHLIEFEKQQWLEVLLKRLGACRFGQTIRTTLLKQIITELHSELVVSEGNWDVTKTLLEALRLLPQHKAARKYKGRKKPRPQNLVFQSLEMARISTQCLLKSLLSSHKLPPSEVLRLPEWSSSFRDALLYLKKLRTLLIDKFRAKDRGSKETTIFSRPNLQRKMEQVLKRVFLVTQVNPRIWALYNKRENPGMFPLDLLKLTLCFEDLSELNETRLHMQDTVPEFYITDVVSFFGEKRVTLARQGDTTKIISDLDDHGLPRVELEGLIDLRSEGDEKISGDKELFQSYGIFRIKIVMTHRDLLELHNEFDCLRKMSVGRKLVRPLVVPRKFDKHHRRSRRHFVGARESPDTVD